jgi:predicted TIM-barrel enzyme
MIRAANRGKVDAVPYVIAEAQFIAHYGADMLRYRSDLTSDGLIPYRAFVLFLAAMPSSLALQAVNQCRAISISLAGAFGDKQASRRLKKLIGEASGR